MGRLGESKAAVAVLLVLISAGFLMASISAPAQATSVQLTGKYIMAFLACNTSVKQCSNPQNHVTYLAESNDSINWSSVPAFKPYPGSVPDVIGRTSTLYIYNPGTIVRFHLDTGVQDAPITVTLKYANGTTAIFVDPSVILDSAGTLHLFYLPGIVGQDPASCPTGQSTCTKQIMSATEVAGSDGGSFVVDAGVRASYTVQGCCFSDPAVFSGPGGYYLYVSEGQAVIAFRSATLTGSYSTMSGLNNGLLVPSGEGGVPAGYYDNSASSFWTFVSKGSAVQVIQRASTPSISAQIPASSFSTIISGATFPGLGSSYTVESPGFHLNTLAPAITSSSSTTTASSTTSVSSSSTTTSTTSTSATSSTTSASSTTTPSTSTTTTASSTSATSSSTTTSSTTSATSTSSFTTTAPSTSTTTSTSSTSTTTAMSSSSTTTATTAFTSPTLTATFSSTGAGGAGIAEFPYQLLALAVFTVVIVTAFVLVRRGSRI